MSEHQDGRRGRRRKRSLSAEEKLQIWLQLLSGEVSQRQAAERWDVDPTTIMRIRRVARTGALSALAQSKPGVRQGGEDAELAAARAEIARLEETRQGAGDRVGGAAGKAGPSPFRVGSGVAVA
jgi:transposase-like protein